MPREPPVTNAFLPSRLKLGKVKSADSEAATLMSLLLVRAREEARGF